MSTFVIDDFTVTDHLHPLSCERCLALARAAVNRALTCGSMMESLFEETLNECAMPVLTHSVTVTKTAVWTASMGLPWLSSRENGSRGVR